MHLPRLTEGLLSLRSRFLATKNKKVIVGILLVGIFLVSATVSYLFLSLSKIFVKNETNSTGSQQIHTFTNNQDGNSILSVLLLGYGGAGHDGGTLSDVLMQVVIDYKTKKVALISIPRDLWVEIPVRSDAKEYFKINMAHAIGVDDVRYGLKEPQFRGAGGGGTLAKHVSETVTGIPIDYFVSVSFDGFKEAIDILGGVDVIVPVTFDDRYYPIKGKENETCGFTSAEIDLFHRMHTGFELEKQFECRYEHLHFEVGKNHMDGDTALKFVRSRHSDTHGGDFARSQRQQAVLDAVKSKLISLDTLGNTKGLVDTLSTVIRTDADLSIVNEIVELLGDPESYSVTNINLSTDNVLTNSTSSGGAYILIPKEGIGKWDEIQKFISESL